MTDDPLVWVTAVVQVGTAAGIGAFWATWFRQPHAEPWQPVGYVEHERVFVFPDSLCATVLVVSAVLAVLDEPWGPTLGLVAAGMLTFLGVIDAAYYAQHGLYARERDGLLNAAIVVAVLVVAALLVLTYH
ncbi:hypothetical protein [Nocardioides panaciterrulae]|uniref:Uncharacterized protein n=1 Tax=Nocardioides panaciterrulae TaxID=661492 RepID=A0A7Y9E8I9_9ACTN|nr:hypothetical protein [Nocardioides panaciterrulae]NYD43189.1 hypothetical protein [Nocardioides panaciterrulae]